MMNEYAVISIAQEAVGLGTARKSDNQLVYFTY